MDRLKYVVSLIESSVSTARHQAEFCEEHSKAILAQPFSNLELRLEANRDAKRLADKMDQEGVYNAYLWYYRRSDRVYEEFKNLYGYIDYLDYLIDDMIKTNERILEFMWQRKKEYQISFKKLKELIQALAVDEHTKNERPEFVEYSIKSLKHFLDKEQKNENLVESYQAVVQPVRNYIAEKVQQHPKVTEIYLILDDLVGQYYAIELQAKHNASDYALYAEALSKSAEKLENGSERLQSDFS